MKAKKKGKEDKTTRYIVYFLITSFSIIWGMLTLGLPSEMFPFDSKVLSFIFGVVYASLVYSGFIQSSSPFREGDGK